jgi:capsular polysaccharide biosynthesis protein
MVVLMVAIVLGATLAAFVSSNAKEPVYGGRVQVLVNTEGSDSESEFNRRLATQREILRSEPVLGPVAKAAGISTKQLRDDTSVKSIGESEILEITVGAPARGRARSLAQEVAESYVQRIVADPVDDPGAATTFMYKRIDELTAARVKAESELAALEGARAGAGEPTAAETRLRAETLELTRSIATLEDRVTGLELGRAAASDVRIVAPARVLDDPIEPKPKQAAAGGFLIGSLIAAGTLFALRGLATSHHREMDSRRGGDLR